MPKSAYVHIPFCQHKCDFCDFAAFAGLEHLSEEYCQIVCREIAERLSPRESLEPLSSIFYGGGTPGLIEPCLLGTIQEMLSLKLGLENDCEVTLETTPQAISADKIKQWLNLGINRISIGVESLHDDELANMGRDHSRQEALLGIERVKNAGFPNISCDLMFGLAGQSLASWEKTLDDLLALELDHVSAYGLTIAGNSPLLRRFPLDSPHYPPEEVYAKMYEMLCRKCQEKGLERYEISNFARPGFASRHNLAYWANEEFYGFGVSAHRFLDSVRSSNLRSLAGYMKNWLKDETYEVLDLPTRAREALFLALRTVKGLDLQAFEKTYGIKLSETREKEIAQFASAGLLELADNCLRLTTRGVLLSSTVMSELI